MKVLFRVDANSAIGGGHFQRCLTLAKNWERKRCTIHFASFQLEEKFREVLPERWGFSNLASFTSVPERAFDVCVLDHYGIGIDWETTILEKGTRLLVLDDLGRKHRCDLIWDPGFYPNKEARYRDSTATQKLLGPEYAILGPEYAELRSQVDRSRVHRKELVLMFGALDPHRFSLPYARAAIDAWDGPIALVVSRRHPDFATIEMLASANSKINVLSDLPSLAAIFARADLYLGAGGGSTWERFCLGLPSVVLAVAENQEIPAKALAEGGFQEYLGRAENIEPEVAVRAANALLNHGNAWQRFADASFALVDGRGVERIPLP